MSAIWIAYTSGAVLGAIAADRWGRHGAIAAVIVLVTLVAIDIIQPIGGHERPAEPHEIS